MDHSCEHLYITFLREICGTAWAGREHLWAVRTCTWMDRDSNCRTFILSAHSLLLPHSPVCGIAAHNFYALISFLLQLQQNRFLKNSKTLWTGDRMQEAIKVLVWSLKLEKNSNVLNIRVAELTNFSPNAVFLKIYLYILFIFYFIFFFPWRRFCRLN